MVRAVYSSNPLWHFRVASMKELGAFRLRDMKLTKAEKEDSMPMAMPSHEMEYPYGLRLSLDDDSLSKLGIATPKHDQHFRVVGSGCVKSVSVSENEHGMRRHVEVQLEKLLLVSVETEKPDEVVIRTA